MEEKNVEQVTVKIIGIDEITEKAEKLIALLKEAKSIENELASYQYNFLFK